jgi:hypothetical protein
MMLGASAMVQRWLSQLFQRAWLVLVRLASCASVPMVLWVQLVYPAAAGCQLVGAVFVLSLTCAVAVLLWSSCRGVVRSQQSQA